MRKYLAVITLCIALTACKKTALAPCSGNCTEVHVSGDILLQPAGTGFAGVPITVQLSATNCIICSQSIVTTQKTDANGRFDFVFNIDTTLLPGHKLYFYFANMQQYISVPYSYINQNLISRDILVNYPSYNNGLHFWFYPKASLQVNLHRVSTGSFAYFSVEHSFDSQPGITDYIIAGNQALPQDTTFIVETAANVFTKVTASTIITPGNNLATADSIKCSAMGNNVIRVDY